MTSDLRRKFIDNASNILAADPACVGRVCTASLDAIAEHAIIGVGIALRNRSLEEVAGWLDEEGKAHVKAGSPAEADQCGALSLRIRALKKVRP